MENIRRAGREDGPALRELLGAQLAEHDIALGDEALARAIDGVFEEPSRGVFLVATVDGELVGVACLSFIWTLEHGGRSAWLDELYVLPAWRGQGVGTRLVRATLREAQVEGCAAVDLEVEASHGAVERLYAREGFAPHRRTRWVRPVTGADAPPR